MDNYNMTFPPNMDKVFGMLSTGYHLCIDDGAAYEELSENEKFYRKLFSLLGFNLCDGKDGIYYFLPSDDKVNDVSKKYMVFMAIMYDYLSDQGKDPVSSMIEEHFYIDKLPHLSVDQYKKTMGQLDITDQQALAKIVQGLNRYGFLDLIDGSLIKFRKTVTRFVSIFSDIADAGNKEDTGENVDE